ncbi:hypothetical protein HJC23_007162 [Cyclotella cryptica]|uniref:Smr domain-containing protein n=1 Tax=Cyclotella cryptica TaxID=29204 RepID=A0ABD3QQ17_9STRA|eukprot:CCRYP_003419-RA/>CCRYP_003419-RA protein AED:0.36 eAED:0.36 QI:0/-1/0/1/-1/1/1/0/1103
MKFVQALLLTSGTSSAFHLPHSPKRVLLHSTAQNSEATSVPPSSPVDSPSSKSTQYQRSLRAGEEGYSLIRRPVAFDDSDPIFQAPRSLREEEEAKRNDVNREWFESRRSKGAAADAGVLGEYASIVNGGSKDSDSGMEDMTGRVGNGLNGKIHKTRQREEDQQLDMHRRTLETLDYQLVLKALSEECGTVKGREIVWNSAHGGAGGGNNNGDSELDLDADVATMPLTATTLQGVHRRYDALREMELLMDGRVDGWIIPSSRKEQLLQSNLSRPSNGSNSNNNSSGKKKRPQRKPLGRPPIEGLSFDLQPILDILDRNEVLEGPEILEIATMLECCMDVVDWGEALKVVNEENEQQQQQPDLKQQSFVELLKFTEAIQIDPTLFSLLTNAFDDEGKLSGITFPTIGRLRSKVRTLKQSILSSIDSLLASPSIQRKLALESGGALTMEINGRIVIPVQQQYQNLGIVHDASRSGKTAYVEPTEVVGPTNELRQAEAELRAEEARVWRELTETIIQHREEIEKNVAAVAQLDVVMSRVKLGKRLEGVVPVVRDEGVVSVKEARHPILLLRGIEGVVGSDVEIGMGDNQGLILTGPNSGGKTVILKLLGLYAFMAKDGIPVPSKAYETARVDFFSPILADIGDLQSVDGDLSTFSGHLLVCREVLKASKKNSLVLMDELGSGTDPNQGVAIARALLEALLDKGCRVAITTHYLELKQLASSDSRFAVAGMQFLGGMPTYKLIPGMIGESFALAVAERLKLPQSVITRANELLDTDTRKMGELIRDLEDQKLLVEQKGEELKKREMELLELKADMKRQQERLEAKQLNARREEAKKFAAKLEEKERLLEDILEKLKGSGASKKVVAESWNDIRIVKREALNEAENLPGIMSRLQQQQQQSQIELIPISEMKGVVTLNLDDKVIVCKKGAFYGKEGIVKEVGKKVQVSVDGVPVRLTTKEIAFPPSSEGARNLSTNNDSNREATLTKLAKRGIDLESTEEASVDVAASSKARDRGITMRMDSNTVNCIGMNFEESKRKCIDAFSKATMSNRSVVYILHGHGTGVLKQKIRTWLSSDRRWVKSFGPAEQVDGGEALTRVELKKQNLFEL